MELNNMSDVIDRFIRYVQMDTQSDPKSTSCPSSEKQLELAKLLVNELQSMGVDDVKLDNNGYVIGSLPTNVNHYVPTIGWIAHMDTSPEMNGANVNPQFVKNYDGADIILNASEDIVLSPKDFPDLLKYKGQTLITTDGTSLLGADDKAGIAAIMSAVKHLTDHPEIPHGTIRIGFTPDEEIGRGADRFNVEAFDADFAYTVDGGELGELEYENFNAAGAKVTIKGRGVHPGSAKNKLINAINIAIEFADLLPVQMRPEYTENYEGFFHLVRFDGSIELTELMYIIREHDREKFEWQKDFFAKSVDLLNLKYGDGTVTLEMKDQYYNMKEKIFPVMHLIDTAKEAIEQLNIEPKIIPIRGGTDGSRLSYMGLPCPNLFAGGHNFHGRYEFIPVESLEKASQVILKIIDLYSKRDISYKA
jgi:tripeptide aminopeptidase